MMHRHCVSHWSSLGVSEPVSELADRSAASFQRALLSPLGPRGGEH